MILHHSLLILLDILPIRRMSQILSLCTSMNIILKWRQYVIVASLSGIIMTWFINQEKWTGARNGSLYTRRIFTLFYFTKYWHTRQCIIILQSYGTHWLLLFLTKISIGILVSLIPTELRMIHFLILHPTHQNLNRMELLIWMDDIPIQILFNILNFTILMPISMMKLDNFYHQLLVHCAGTFQDN